MLQDFPTTHVADTKREMERLWQKYKLTRSDDNESDPAELRIERPSVRYTLVKDEHRSLHNLGLCHDPKKRFTPIPKPTAPTPMQTTPAPATARAR